MSSKISALSAASALNGTETFPLVQSSTTKKGLISAIATYLAGITAWLPFSKLTGSISIAQMGASGYASGSVVIAALSVNFNSANTDTSIAITLPTGFTRYILAGARISGASASLTTATCSLWTAAGGTGTAIVASGTAITVSTASENTANNTQNLTPATGITLNLGTLYFRVQTAQGSAATANVTLILQPLP